MRATRTRATRRTAQRICRRRGPWTGPRMRSPRSSICVANHPSRALMPAQRLSGRQRNVHTSEMTYSRLHAACGQQGLINGHRGAYRKLHSRLPHHQRHGRSSIKTDLNSLARLDTQLTDHYRTFDLIRHHEDKTRLFLNTLLVHTHTCMMSLSLCSLRKYAMEIPDVRDA